MSRSPAQLLAAALASDPGRPFVTFYDEETGERIELSVTTFANWVAKTANLLVDGLGLGPGDQVWIDLPRHWQAPVWSVAAWCAGLTVALGGDPADAELAVVGPASLEAGLAAPEVVALSLRPLGAPFGPGELPAGVLDYAREVAGYGDRFNGPVGGDAPLVVTSAGPLGPAESGTQAEGRAGVWALAAGGRLLLADPLDQLDEVLGASLVPLLVGGSGVQVRGAGPSRINELATAERVTARATR